LTAFDFQPHAVDVEAGPQIVTCEMGLTDAPAGVRLAQCLFRSPSGTQQQGCGVGFPSSGDSFDGVYRCDISIPQFAESGTWVAWVVSADDQVGNGSLFYYDELRARGFPTDLAVSGGACSDRDGDGRCDESDNCPDVSNDDQADLDGDGLGDACDPCPLDPGNDGDSDGVCGNVDSCPGTPNTNQADADGDGIGDVCDPCPVDGANDADHDGVCGDLDNCPTTPNADQHDTNGDGIGDACEGDASDADGDGVPDSADACDHSILDPTVIVPPVAPPPPPPGSSADPVVPCDSGVGNDLLADGCTISDKIAACDAATTNKGQFDKCVKRLLQQLRRQGAITEAERHAIDRCVKKYKKRDLHHHGSDGPHATDGHDH
jgi:hypothetical protein